MASGDTGSDSISFVSRQPFVIDLHERTSVRGADEIQVPRELARRHMGNSGNPVIITCRTPLRHAWNTARPRGERRKKIDEPRHGAQLMRPRLYRFFGAPSRIGYSKKIHPIFCFSLSVTSATARKEEHGTSMSPAARFEFCYTGNKFSRCCFITGGFRARVCSRARIRLWAWIFPPFPLFFPPPPPPFLVVLPATKNPILTRPLEKPARHLGEGNRK